MESQQPSLFTAREIMTTGVVAVRPETMIDEAVDLFEQHRVSGLPVVDDRNQLLGVITEYDLLRSISELNMCGTVADLMSTEVVTVSEDTTLVELAELLVSTRVRRLPVTRYGELIGVISRRDIIFAGNIRQRLLSELPMSAALV